MGFNGDPAHCFLVLVALRRPLGCSVEGSGGARGATADHPANDLEG
jgi:hypothetical protein